MRSLAVRIRSAAACCGLLVLAGCGGSSTEPPPLPAHATPAGTAVGTAVIEGRVAFTGAVRPPRPIDTRSDASCRHKQESPPVLEDLVVGEGGALANAFVSVTGRVGDKPFAPPAAPVTLDQRGCTYRPHVVGVQVGQALRLLNSDPTLHNVHTLSKLNPSFNFGMPIEGQETIRRFVKPEIMVKAKCDVHPWMGAWIGVVPHPFFQVTGPDGAFSLRGLPAGTWQVEVWHESLGTQSLSVTVSDGGRQTADFSFPR
jgi:plastocyanin